MRKIIVSNYVTLDGFFEGENHAIDWFIWDTTMAEYSKEILHSIDTILFGRVTYELMAGFWPAPEAETAEDPEITNAMNNLQKIVFFNTLEKAEWNNTKLVRGKAEEEVIKLKKQEGKDMVIFGSGLLTSSLTNAGLIDELRIVLNPLILGKGTPHFRNIDERIKLELLDVRSSANGNVMLIYRPGNIKNI